MQQQTLVGASTTPGHALRVGEERKMAAHAGPCRAAGVTFIPLVVESLGGWSEEAIYTIKSIGRLQGQRLGIPPPETTRHLFQRLSISLWGGGMPPCGSDGSLPSPPQWTALFDLFDIVLSVFECMYIFWLFLYYKM